LPDKNCLTNLRTYLTERKDKVFTVKSTSLSAKEFFLKKHSGAESLQAKIKVYIWARLRKYREIFGKTPLLYAKFNEIL
jgi:hypothetical protein